jgi:hypothetical protein
MLISVETDWKKIMNDEKVKVWKEVIVDPQICFKKTRTTIPTGTPLWDSNRVPLESNSTALSPISLFSASFKGSDAVAVTVTTAQCSILQRLKGSCPCA